MNNWRWRDNNRVRLVENGEEYFPLVFAAIESATIELVIETFILIEDSVGRQLQRLLVDAARRGVRVTITVDGYGSGQLSPEFITDMQSAGVHLRMFEPSRRWFGVRVNLLRRLHRKLVVIDARIAYVGGINFSEDQLRTSGANSKQDYAIEVEGPVVADIRDLVLDVADSSVSQAAQPWWQQFKRLPVAGTLTVLGHARVLLAHRDNQFHRNDIERLYRVAIRAARHHIVIANAYFFPGYRLIRLLRMAARRGVKVQLLLQGKPDIPLARFLSTTLYAHLAHAGVEIFEYYERPFHAKVAVIDGQWSTVGSSNLDPLSLALNFEANLFVMDAEFATLLHARLQHLMAQGCVRVDATKLKSPSLLSLIVRVLGFQVTRQFLSIGHWLPKQLPKNKSLTTQQVSASEREERR